MLPLPLLLVQMEIDLYGEIYSHGNSLARRGLESPLSKRINRLPVQIPI